MDYDESRLEQSFEAMHANHTSLDDRFCSYMLWTLLCLTIRLVDASCKRLLRK